MIKAGKLVFLLTFFAFMVQSLLLFSDRADELMAIPFALLLAGIAVFFLGKDDNREDADFQINIFLWAFAVRIQLGVMFYGWGLGELFGDEDASGYLSGWTFAQNWYSNGIDGFVSDLSSVFFEKANTGQSIIWGIPTFFAGGPSRMIVSVLNSFAGSLLVVVIFRLSRILFDSATARVAASIVAFWASIVLLSVGTSKEILVILVEWFLLYVLIRDANGFSVKDGLLAIPAFLALYITRFYAVYIVAGAAFIRFLVSRKEHVVRNMIFGTLVLFSVFVFLNAGGMISRDFERLDKQNEMIEGWRENMAESTGSGVEVFNQYESQTVAIPVATVYFFFAPFPWELFSGSIRNGFGAIENVAIIIMLIIGLPALRIIFKERLAQMAPGLAFCVVYAGFQIWGLSNVGLAWRHKQTVMPLFFMFLAVAIVHRREGFETFKNTFGRRKLDTRVLPTR